MFKNGNIENLIKKQLSTAVSVHLVSFISQQPAHFEVLNKNIKK